MIKFTLKVQRFLQQHIICESYYFRDFTQIISISIDNTFSIPTSDYDITLFSYESIKSKQLVKIPPSKFFLE